MLLESEHCLAIGDMHEAVASSSKVFRFHLLVVNHNVVRITVQKNLGGNHPTESFDCLHS